MKLKGVMNTEKDMLEHYLKDPKKSKNNIYMGKIFKKGKYMETASWIAVFAIAIILAFLIIGSVISKLL